MRTAMRRPDRTEVVLSLGSAAVELAAFLWWLHRTFTPRRSAPTKPRKDHP